MTTDVIPAYTITSERLATYPKPETENERKLREAQRLPAPTFSFLVCQARFHEPLRAPK